MLWAGDFVEGAMLVGSCRLSKKGLYPVVNSGKITQAMEYTGEVFQAQREVNLNVVAVASLGMPFPAD